MEAIFSSWFLGPYKVSKIWYGLFLYALQPAQHTSASFMGAILEEYLVHDFMIWLLIINTTYRKQKDMVALFVAEPQKGNSTTGKSPFFLLLQIHHFKLLQLLNYSGN